MSEPELTDRAPVLARIRAQAAKDHLRITQHAHREMVEEGVTLDQVLQAIGRGEILENYPEHRRGPCCLLHGITGEGRDIHVVCTTGRQVLIIIRVYEPKPPKWLTPTKRNR